ncbi:MAG: GNAT family N-acetyltransferase [Limisphaerales bacterium]
MTTTPSIRSATMDDFGAVGRLLREVDEHHVHLRPDVFQPFDDPKAMRLRIAGFIENENAEMIVAEVESAIVGLATVQIHDHPDAPMFRPGRRAIMSDLVVDPKSRRSGLGKTLLAVVVAWSRARGFESLGLNIWNANEEGLDFFTANGFLPRCQQMDLKIDS